MFKKIEIWVLYLVILLGIVSAVGFGVLVIQELVGSIKVGWVSKTALTLAEIPMKLKKIVENDFITKDKFPSRFSASPQGDLIQTVLDRLIKPHDKRRKDV